MEIIKKRNQIEILELKKKMNEMRNKAQQQAQSSRRKYMKN